MSPGRTPTPTVAAPTRPLLPLLPLLLGACGGSAPPPVEEIPGIAAAEGPVGEAALVDRGRYLVRNVAVCGQCHARDVADPDGPLVGGESFSGWRTGTVVADNLTPHPGTGLGGWTRGEVVRAVRLGADREGDVLAPIMPYVWFNGLSDRDAAAMAAYLASLDPVAHATEDDTNLVFKAADLIFLGPEDRPAGPRRAPPRGPTPEYGEYLARSVGLCADCHTPHGGIRSQADMDRLFAGQAEPPESFPANPDNLTPDSATGIGGWSEEDFLRTIRTGVNPEGDTLHPFMSWRQYRRMTEDDLRAIYRYLRTVPSVEHEVPESEGG